MHLLHRARALILFFKNPAPFLLPSQKIVCLFLRFWSHFLLTFLFDALISLAVLKVMLVLLVTVVGSPVPPSLFFCYRPALFRTT
jgi:hypothetical protein